MEELLQKLQNEHGLTAEQSKGILGTIIGYIKEKFPMVSGAVDNLFPMGSTTSPSQASSAAGTQDAAGGSVQGGDLLDKISDFIPGETAEKIEEFAKDKLGSFFGGNKNA